MKQVIMIRGWQRGGNFKEDGQIGKQAGLDRGRDRNRDMERNRNGE